MYINFKKLNLGIPFLQSNLDIANIRTMQKFDSSSVLNPSLISMIHESGLKVGATIAIYYHPSPRGSNIHIDDEGIADQTNLNFVIDKGSAMTNWYNTIEGYSGHLSKNIFTTLRRYDINKLILIESINTAGVGLFQSGVPHNVSNVTSARWCFSVKLKTLDYNVVKWEDAVRIFEKFIIN